MPVDPYKPKSDELREIRLRLSEASWLERVADARRRLKIVEKVNKKVGNGRSQNDAIEATVPQSKRSATLRDLKSYREHGFEGLIDRRTPRDPEIARRVRDAIEVARMANPSITVEQAMVIVKAKYEDDVPSSSSIKRIWKSAGLERPVGRPVQSAGHAEITIEQDLEAAGFRLVRAAEAETQAIAALTDTVLEVAEELPEPGAVPASAKRLRNAKGQLTGRYNRARRKKRGEVIAAAHRTAEEKAEARDLGRLSFCGQQRETIERKLWALASIPAVTPLSGRIEDLRGPDGRLLEEMCGYEYQTETIRKLVSEFTLAGLGLRFQQAQAQTWHNVSVERWEHDYRAHIVYVDNNVKPLWTGLFAKSTKVSSTGRVQPALTSTFVNTGVGVPIHYETWSGSAPLAPRVLALLEQVEEEHKQPVGRLTVIDGECCSAPLLVSFAKAQRDLIVPLPAHMIDPKRFRYGRGSGFQPDRDNDRIREGTITLRSKDVTVDARAIIIERRSKETWTVLTTLATPEDWSARGLADAYFGRWPNQEGFFRRANQAVGLKQVHGYGKRIVANTAALTELETLEARVEQGKVRLAEESEQLELIENEFDERHKELRRVERYRAKREERVDERIDDERTHTRSFVTASTDLRKSLDEERALQEQVASLTKKQQELAAKVERREGRIETWERESNKLGARKTIAEADVAQDTLFTAMKLTLAMLVHFIAVEYFPHRPIEWATFLSRIARLPGRREFTAERDTVFIYGNRRDLKLMKALDRACQRINERALVDSGGRRLRYVLEWPDGIPDVWPE